VTKAGSGTGTVTSSPAGIDCGSTCVATFSSGTTVTLTATPTGRSRFVGWSGDCSGKGSCVLLMTADHSVTATFARRGGFVAAR
jgi:endoglucanase